MIRWCHRRKLFSHQISMWNLIVAWNEGWSGVDFSGLFGYAAASLTIMWPTEHHNIMANLPRIHKVHGYCFNPFLMFQHQKIAGKVSRISTTDKGFVYIKYHHYINLWTLFSSLHEFLILRKRGKTKFSCTGEKIFNEIFRMKDKIFVLKWSGLVGFCLIIYSKNEKVYWKPCKGEVY